MLCEECHQNEAVYTISVMMGEAMTQRHLCADCMAKMNMNIASGNMQKLLGAILNAINRGEQPEEGEKVPDDQPDITCPRCRMTLSKFIKTGRLGCPDCYQAFAAQLQAYKDGGFERVNPSILKADILTSYPDFTERSIGFKRFSDVMKQLEKDGLVVVEMDEQKTMLIKLL